MKCVMDASVVASLFLPDEASGRAAELIREATGEGLVAPGLMQLEVMNILLMAKRRGRIDGQQFRVVIGAFDRLPITLQPVLSSEQKAETARLAEQHGLTAYDAAYLELAMRMGMPLATLDEALAKAAGAEGVEVMR